MKFLLHIALVWASLFLFQAQAQEPLDLKEIMQGEKYIGYSPTNIRWAEDQSAIYFDWNPDGLPTRVQYRQRIGADGERLGKPELAPQGPEKGGFYSQGAYNHTRTRKAYTKDGDLFFYNRENGEEIQITQTLAYESNPHFFDHEKAVAFQRDGNLYAWYIDNGRTVQLTDFRSGAEKKENDSPQEAFLKTQQKELFTRVQDLNTQRNFLDSMRKAHEAPKPKAIFLAGKGILQINGSPDGNTILFKVSEEAKVKFTQVHDPITESGYTTVSEARVKVGSPRDVYWLGIYDRKRDTVFYANFASLKDIKKQPEYFKEYGREMKAEDARPVIPHGPFWSSDGAQVFYVMRSRDNKDRWIALLSPTSGNFKTLDHQRNEAWVGGPGISGWNFYAGNVGWLPSEHTIYFQSEETGYSHLYEMEVISGKKKALTEGNFEIETAEFLPHNNRWLITANVEHPGDFRPYFLPEFGGNLLELGHEPGLHEVFPSPDGEWLAVRYSTRNQPWELYITHADKKSPYHQITNSTSEKFKAHKWHSPEITSFTAEDGAKVHARLYLPEGGKAERAVIFVHGAGYLQNVHYGWSTYYREYMFHNLLREKGYAVLDIDYRGSKGYGSDWRTGIYRHMGGKDLSDHVDGAKFLSEKYNIPKDKIGIYGGSYGGFITLMALFKHPETFQCGAALRSVTDWAHYNHPYASNILNTPVLDSIAYRRSSPIYFAEGLEKRLLMCHGMMDDNVQFQDIVRLSQRLMELGKTNWELATYPDEPHGFTAPSSWLDEYSRILKLFEEELR